MSQYLASALILLLNISTFASKPKAVILPKGWQVAYSARIYYPDKRKSYYQIYLSDLSGKHRRQITTDQAHHYLGCWKGHQRLTWMKALNGDQYEYWMMEMFSFKKWRISQKEYQACFPQIKEQEIISDDSQHRVLKWTKSIADDAATLEIEKAGVQYKLKWINPQAEFLLEYANDPFNFVYQLNSISFKKLIPTRNTNISWLLGDSGVTAHESSKLAFLVDWKQRTMKLVYGQFERISFLPDSNYFAAHTDRKLRPLTKDGSTVWVSDAYAGNWRTGKKWRIAPPIASLNGIQLRPRSLLL